VELAPDWKDSLTTDEQAAVLACTDEPSSPTLEELRTCLAKGLAVPEDEQHLLSLIATITGLPLERIAQQ
jgi:hypothetical protein